MLTCGFVRSNFSLAISLAPRELGGLSVRPEFNIAGDVLVKVAEIKHQLSNSARTNAHLPYPVRPNETDAPIKGASAYY
jgi:hypothetical protein